MFDRLDFGAPQTWYLPTALGLLAMLAVLAIAYRMGVASGRIKVFASLLKVLAFLALAICILEPLQHGTRPRPHANVMGVMVDNSSSMQLKTHGKEHHKQVQRLLDRNTGWRTRLEQDFDVRDYAFDARVSNMDDFSSLEFDGQASSLGEALETVHARFKNRPVAGLLLFTDGNSTDALRDDWSEFKFPVYPVYDPSDEVVEDIRLSKVTVAQTDFETAPVTLQSTIEADGLVGQEVIAILKDQDGGVIEEQTHTIGNDQKPIPVRFQFKPKKSGVQFYHLTVCLEKERHAFEKGLTSHEITVKNNEQLITVDRQQGPYRVLYVAGRPNWEFKFIRRALAEEEEIQLVGLLRIAKKEPKFSFRDQGLASTSQLFRGFDNEDEQTTEQYDEPVILRLGISESDELSDGFPKTIEELFGYQAVILDDIESSFFTQDQMLMLRRFVSERGGGLLFLGGQEAMENGNYQHTPLGDLSPVYLRDERNADIKGPYRLGLTREGWLQPWMRLRSTEEAERKRLSDVVAFATLNVPDGVKPGAATFASVQTEDHGELPALTVQRFGKGRTAALMVGDLWRWGMRRTDDDQDDLAQLWRQIVRYLVNDATRRVQLDVEQPADPTEAVTIRVTAKNEDFDPLDNANVEISVESDNDTPFVIRAEPSDRIAGVYETEYWPRNDGAYKVTAKVTGEDGSLVGKHRESGWTSQPTAAEFRTLTPNLELLERIADQTGGQVIPAKGLNELVTSLPSRKVPVTEDWVYPIWHRPWVLLAIVAALCGEWGLRRLNGLP